MAEVLHLFESPAKGKAMRECDEVIAVADKGFEHCVHGRCGSRRQVLLMDIEMLDDFGIPPGRAKENITTSKLNVNELRPGERLKAGEALLEVTLPCEPCDQMDLIRQGLQEELQGRRGVLCRVIQSGRLRRGDAIEMATGEDLGPEAAAP